MPAGEMQVLLFTLNGVYYGVDVHQVREIREVQKITPVPYAPYYIEGVTNLRGEVIPVLNLRKRFGIESSGESRTMVIVQDKDAIGVLVDSVLEVMDIEKSSIEATPEILTTADSDCVLGVAKRKEDLIILLDLLKVVSKKDVEIVKATPAHSGVKKENKKAKENKKQERTLPAK